MQFLTLDAIKRHLRLDNDCEDAELELYGAAAEETVLARLNRSLADLKCAGHGEVPKAVVTAALMITDNFYQHRGTSEPQNLYLIPYGVDALLMPLTIL